MTSPARIDDRPRLAAARARYERSWVRDLIGQLNALEFFEWTTVFGAELLWSALPFLILLSSLANHRIEDDLSAHIGLDQQGTHIVEGLFRSSPSHAFFPVATGLLFSFAGIVAVVASLQVIYERLFGLEHRRWRGFPRYVAWIAVVLGVLVVEGIVDKPERKAAGPVVEGITTLVAATIFFAWTMHFLMAGRVPWRAVIRPAVVTAVLWLALGIFSALYFSTTVVDDSKTFGAIGVVFSLLTWFILIGSVIMLGAAGGAVWQRGATRRREAGAAPPPG
jgi:membrane protein